MTNVRKFNSKAEMEAEAARRRAAGGDVSAQQWALDVGDHWITTGRLGPILGRVATRADIEAHFPSERWATLTQRAFFAVQQGRVFGPAYSVERPSGSWVECAKAEVWPIEERLFLACSEVEWDTSRLDEPMSILAVIGLNSLRSHRAFVKNGAV